MIGAATTYVTILIQFDHIHEMHINHQILFVGRDTLLKHFQKQEG